MNIIKVLKIFVIFILSIFSLAAILTVDAALENLQVDDQLIQFMNKGEQVSTYRDFIFYEVEIEEELKTPSISFDVTGKPYVPTSGDIFVLRESSMNFIPLAAEFITYYFGGHAGIVYDGNTIIETTGMDINPDYNKVITSSVNIFYRHEEVNTIGLRVKAPEEDIIKATNYAYSTLGTPYNYSFIFDRKDKLYCTDLISRSFGKEAGLDYNLDKDGIATSCNDLVISEDTFITYYMVYKGDVKHLYYAVNK